MRKEISLLSSHARQFCRLGWLPGLEFAVRKDLQIPEPTEKFMQETTIQEKGIVLPPMRIVQGLTLDESRDLLDWFEAHGIDQVRFDVDDTGNFMICFPD